MKKEFDIEGGKVITDEEAKRIVISYGDGQGDTYLKTLFVFHTKYRTEEEIARPYIDTIDDLYEELGGNMVNVMWIEDNKLIDVTF
jgi:alkaline phosphatase